MPFEWLDEKTIAEIHEKAVQMGLHDKRDYLLHDLPMSLTDKMPEEGNDADQLLRDLKHLNQHRVDKDGLLPIAVWLENALITQRAIA